MVKGKKVVFTVRVDEEVLNVFKKIVYMKHSRPYGALGYELEEALKHWISLHTHTNLGVMEETWRGRDIHAEPHSIQPHGKVNPEPRVAQVFRQIKEVLESKYHYINVTQGTQIPLTLLEKAIADTRGIDQRTISKWVNLLVKHHLIKPITSKLFEVT